MIQLFCDGGLVGAQPFTLAGTWAYVVVVDGQAFRERSGIIRVAGTTNNQTEMYALLMGLKALPSDFAGEILSDSMVTLGRVFLSWKWNNIPDEFHTIFREQTTRLKNWGTDRITYTLLDGHPSKAQLAAGIGKRGHMVSAFNVWCDAECNRRSAEYKADILIPF